MNRELKNVLHAHLKLCKDIEIESRQAMTKVYDKTKSFELFNDIYWIYDFLNKALSFGLDRYWRYKLSKTLCDSLKEHSECIYLDVATGTADQIISMSKRRSFTKIIGLDKAANMLKIAEKKLRNTPTVECVDLFESDMHALSFSDATFDAITLSFGIRNANSPLQSLRELHRVMKQGGVIGVLEFSQPTFNLFKPLHGFYLKRILPVIGRLFSRHQNAYQYLADTIETFPSGEHFCDIMQAAGFKKTKATPLNFGIVTLYTACKT